MKRKLPNVFRKEEIISFFDSVGETSVAMGCLTAFCCGLRIGEVISLKWINIDLDERSIKIVNGKTGDGYVDIPKDILPILKKWKYLTSNQEYFIPFENDLYESRKNHLTKGFHRALKKAGLLIPYTKNSKGVVRNKLTFHSWRHTFATFIWEKSGDIYLVQKSLRHSAVRTTEIYTHVSDPKKKEKIDSVFSIANDNQSISLSSGPLAILQKRLASGEVSLDDYKKILSELQPKQDLGYIG